MPPPVTHQSSKSALYPTGTQPSITRLVDGAGVWGLQYHWNPKQQCRQKRHACSQSRSKLCSQYFNPRGWSLAALPPKLRKSLLVPAVAVRSAALLVESSQDTRTVQRLACMRCDPRLHRFWSCAQERQFGARALQPCIDTQWVSIVHGGLNGDGFGTVEVAPRMHIVCMRLHASGMRPTIAQEVEAFQPRPNSARGSTT